MLGDVGDDRPLPGESTRRASRCRRGARARSCRAGCLRASSGRSRRRMRRGRRPHELLVMAVHGSSFASRCISIPGPDQLVAHVANFAAIRMKERQRRSGPGEHAHLDALRGTGEQLPECRASPRPQPKRRREKPAGDLDVRLRRANVVDHARQHLGAVDEELDPRSPPAARTRPISAQPPAGGSNARPCRAAEGGGRGARRSTRSIRWSRPLRRDRVIRAAPPIPALLPSSVVQKPAQEHAENRDRDGDEEVDAADPCQSGRSVGGRPSLISRASPGPST